MNYVTWATQPRPDKGPLDASDETPPETAAMGLRGIDPQSLLGHSTAAIAKDTLPQLTPELNPLRAISLKKNPALKPGALQVGSRSLATGAHDDLQ